MVWYYLTEWIWPHLFTVVGFLFAIVLFSRILGERYSPESTLAWLMAIIFIPYIAVPFYLVLGGRKIRRARKKKAALHFPWAPDSEPQARYGGNIEKVLMGCDVPPARPGNQMIFLPTGEGAYKRLMEMLSEAEETIHITIFILGKDQTARSIVDLLCKKAREGVKVRLLLDSVGSFMTYGRFVESLRQAGGEVGVFMPVLPLRRKWAANLRNHRKMILVDGKRAMVGGMNLAFEYMGPEPHESRWADFAMMVEGPAVADLESIFALDWEFATDESLSLPHGLPEQRDSATLQVVASGPDVPTEPLYDSILACLFQANERVWIVSPYYIPDDSLSRCLCLLARLGVDVRLVVPTHSDYRLLDLGRAPHLRDLTEAGGKVLAFQPNHIHAKLVVIDREVAIIGSANLDIRSLYLNYEVSLFLYSQDHVESLAQIMESCYMAFCKPWHPKRKTYLRSWEEDLARLLAPLL